MNIQTNIAGHIRTISYTRLQLLAQIMSSSESEQDYFDNAIVPSMQNLSLNSRAPGTSTDNYQASLRPTGLNPEQTEQVRGSIFFYNISVL
jgi:hypothetical protein